MVQANDRYHAPPTPHYPYIEKNVGYFLYVISTMCFYVN